MFGAYRFLLAMMVLLQHLAGWRALGAYAVFGFYILSGYLMTLVLHQRYGYSAAGRGRYALNRLLRIYPLYWLACLLALLLIASFGEAASAGFHARMKVPESPEAILRNLFLVLGVETPRRLAPPAWALSVELFYYACIGLGFSRSPRSTRLWLALAIGYTTAALALGWGWQHRYFSVAAASLPFATGALLYHARDGLRRHVRPAAAPLLFLLMLASYGLARELEALRSWGFYLNFALHALIVAVLVGAPGRGLLPALPARWDEWLGDMSYPIYLLHLPAGLLLAASLGLERRDPLLALLATPVVLLLALTAQRALLDPLESLRRRLKPAAARSAKGG